MDRIKTNIWKINSLLLTLTVDGYILNMNQVSRYFQDRTHLFAYINPSYIKEYDLIDLSLDKRISREIIKQIDVLDHEYIYIDDIVRICTNISKKLILKIPNETFIFIVEKNIYKKWQLFF